MTTAIIITMLVVAVMLIAVLCGYTFYLKNEVNYWYLKYAKEEKLVQSWQERCEDLVKIHEAQLDQHDKRYEEAWDSINKLIEEKLNAIDQLEDLKSKYDGLTETLNNHLMEKSATKITSIDDIFGDDIEELDFPNSNNKED